MTTPGTLILTRHGESVSNAGGLFSGWRDTRLTPAGERAATGASVLVVAHGNSLRAPIARVDLLSETDVQQLNIPARAPLRYDSTTALRPVEPGGQYLDPAAARAAAAKVATEGEV